MQFKNRKPSRLDSYDYSKNGMYFVTICTKEREEILGKIVGGRMVLNELGEIIRNNLIGIPNYFKNVFLDEYVVMPNHVHAIWEINVGVQFIEPAYKKSGFNKSIGFDKSNPYKKVIKNNPMLLNKNTLGKIVRYFKAKSAYEIRKRIEFYKFAWQRNYYDHIIRNEISLNKIREYIQKNPKNWEEDRNLPACKAGNVENIWM